MSAKLGAVLVAAGALLVSACGRFGYDPIPLVGGGDDDDHAVPDGGLDLVGCQEPFSAPRRLDQLNVRGVDDWAPYVTADGLHIYLASYRGGGGSDLFVASRDRVGDEFDEPVLLHGGVNSASYESAPALSPDGHTLFFIRPQANDPTRFDIFAAHGDGDDFGRLDFARELSSPARELDVEVSRDGKTIYLASDREGGAGGIDLWQVPVLSGGYGKPEPVAELNSSADEGSMALSADGLEIIFSSNRRGGEGGYDLWHARRARVDDPFSEPARLAEVSSHGDDTRPSLSPDGTTLYFDYDAYEEGGDDSDIWVATRCTN
jgi:Tol biopolymer transport system component